MSKMIEEHFWKKYGEQKVRKKTKDLHINVFASNERPHTIHFTNVSDPIEATPEEMITIGKFLIEIANKIIADPDFNKNQ